MSEADHAAFLVGMGSLYDLGPLYVMRWEKRVGGLTKWHIMVPEGGEAMTMAQWCLEPPLPVTYCGRTMPGVGNKGVSFGKRRKDWGAEAKDEACELCLERWKLAENRRITKRIFQEWGGFVPSRHTFITSPNI